MGYAVKLSSGSEPFPTSWVCLACENSWTTTYFSQNYKHVINAGSRYSNGVTTSTYCTYSGSSNNIVFRCGQSGVNARSGEIMYIKNVISGENVGLTGYGSGAGMTRICIAAN